MGLCKCASDIPDTKKSSLASRSRGAPTTDKGSRPLSQTNDGAVHRPPYYGDALDRRSPLCLEALSDGAFLLHLPTYYLYCSIRIGEADGVCHLL